MPKGLFPLNTFQYESNIYVYSENIWNMHTFLIYDSGCLSQALKVPKLNNETVFLERSETRPYMLKTMFLNLDLTCGRNLLRILALSLTSLRQSSLSDSLPSPVASGRPM